jgi:cytochrome b subunit of formate dehydrogenase
MGVIEFATSPWGQTIPIHAGFDLIWVALIGGLVFLVVHAIYVKFMARPEVFAASTQSTAHVPEKVKRHTGVARLFHWVMAAAMLTLLFTAFLPKVGYPFAWVTYHWIAGLVLTASIVFHIFHASFWMDFWSIWPDKIDMEDARRRLALARGKDAPLPRKFGKYPFENKMYHGIIVLTGLSVTITGLFMMKRVRTPIFTRNPYVFGDMTWGWMYVLHGLAGISLIALIIAHIYFALRPEKLVLTKSMVAGSIDRDHYLEHHDPERWVLAGGQDTKAGAHNA